MPDPISLIATIVLNTSSAFTDSGLPPEVKDQASAAVQDAGNAATAAAVQLDSAIAQLPEPAQYFARQTVADATDRIANAVAPLPSPPVAEPPAPGPGSTEHTPPADEQVPATRIAPDRIVAGPAGAADYSIGPATLRPAAAAAPPPAGYSGDIAVFVPWLRKAGSLCAEVSAPTLAALYAAENGFRYGPSAPVSPAGALGPGQFMPQTWQRYGRDADGDGKADVFGVADSVMASGRFLCDTYRVIGDWKHAGLVSGDTLDLTLAAYNAGAGAVLASGGMPSGTTDYEFQTKPYVARIRANENNFRWLTDPFTEGGTDDLRTRIVQAAMAFLGTPYVWGGGNATGPTIGGFDCSGLTVFAVHAATHGAMTLPRTSQTQWTIGQPIRLPEALPGDLLFGNWGADGPGHVGIYLGDGQMIHAPAPGDVVRVAAVSTGMQARRVI